MRTVALAFVAALAWGSAFAAERAPAPHSPACKSLDKIRAGFDGKTHVGALSAGQMHFAMGLYVASPSTPAGLPPGDGALLVTHAGDKSGMIVWTRGKDGCAPIMIPEQMVGFIMGLGTAPGETVEPDDSSEERKL